MLPYIKKLDHKLFFKYLTEAQTAPYYVYKELNYYQYDEEFTSKVPLDLKEYFKKCCSWWGLEKFYFNFTRKCIIEPSVGWAITMDEKIIPQSIWNYYIHHINKPYYLPYKFWPRKKLKLDSAISLQYAWMNYYHFMDDILGQLNLADQAGLSNDIPIVVPAGLQKRKYFTDLLEISPDLQTRNWIFQDKKTNIYCNNTYFFNTSLDHRENFEGVLRFIDYEHKFDKEPYLNKKLFLTRRADRGRSILNIKEVQDLVKGYSFEVIDCDLLSLAEQIQVFRNAGYVIGIHGAGLTNLIFRKNKPLSLLEIFPGNYFNPSYYWICQQFGYDYQAIIGAMAKTNNSYGNFSIDLKELEVSINKMLGS